MFIEVPNLNKSKKKQIFDIIKNLLNIKKAYYYPVSNNIIYAFEYKDNANLILAKVCKKLLEQDKKKFILFNINKKTDNEKEEEVLEVFIKEKDSIKNSEYTVELGSFVSFIMNNKNIEDTEIFYIKNETLTKYIEETNIITGLDSSHFQEIESEFKKEDFEEIVKEISLKEDFEKIYKIFLVKLKLSDRLNKVKTNLNKKQQDSKRKKVFLIFLIILTVISASGYYYYEEQKKLEEIRIQEELDKKMLAEQQRLIKQRQLEEEERKKKELLRNQERNKIKYTILIKNLQIFDFINYLQSFKNLQMFSMNGIKREMIVEESNLNKINELKEKFSTNNILINQNKVYLYDLDFYKTLMNSINIQKFYDIEKKYYKEQNKIPEIDMFSVSEKSKGNIAKSGEVLTMTFDLNKIDLKELRSLFLNNNNEYQFVIFKTNSSYQLILETKEKPKELTNIPESKAKNNDKTKYK